MTGPRSPNTLCPAVRPERSLTQQVSQGCSRTWPPACNIPGCEWEENYGRKAELRQIIPLRLWRHGQSKKNYLLVWGMAGSMSAFISYWLTLTWVFLRAAQGPFWLNVKVLSSLMDLCEPECIQKAWKKRSQDCEQGLVCDVGHVTWSWGWASSHIKAQRRTPQSRPGH